MAEASRRRSLLLMKLTLSSYAIARVVNEAGFGILLTTRPGLVMLLHSARVGWRRSLLMTSRLPAPSRRCCQPAPLPTGGPNPADTSNRSQGSAIRRAPQRLWDPTQ